MIPRPELGRGAVDVAMLDAAPLVGGDEGCWQTIIIIIIAVVVVVVVVPQANDSVEDVGDAVAADAAAAAGGGGFGRHGPMDF